MPNSKKREKNPEGFLKACKSRLKRLLAHKENHPRDIKYIGNINLKIERCQRGEYRK